MMHEHRLRFKTLFTVFLMVVCANTGDLLLKRGMTRIGAVQVSFEGLKQTLFATVQNRTIWLAILFLIGFTIFYMSAVSWADYSYVMPASALGYATQTLLAIMVLHEAVTLKRWIGVFVICFGVMLVGQTKPNTTNGQEAPS